MKLVKNIVIILSLVCLPRLILGQDFEGTITWEVTKRNVTYQKKHHVLDNQVKIQTYQPDGTLKGEKLVDLSTGKVIALIPERKLYFEVPNKPQKRAIETEVKRTGETRVINETECTEIMVRNKTMNKHVTVWIAGDGFEFYIKLIKALGKGQLANAYLEKVQNKSGAMPFEIIEKTPDGRLLSKQVITHIDQSTPDPSIFKIPEDFSMMER